MYVVWRLQCAAACRSHADPSPGGHDCQRMCAPMRSTPYVHCSRACIRVRVRCISLECSTPPPPGQSYAVMPTQCFRHQQATYRVQYWLSQGTPILGCAREKRRRGIRACDHRSYTAAALGRIDPAGVCTSPQPQIQLGANCVHRLGKVLRGRQSDQLRVSVCVCVCAQHPSQQVHISLHDTNLCESF